jgi:hypothetical protein
MGSLSLYQPIPKCNPTQKWDKHRCFQGTVQLQYLHD